MPYFFCCSNNITGDIAQINMFLGNVLRRDRKNRRQSYRETEHFEDAIV
jgi:hypothetical protein